MSGSKVEDVVYALTVSMTMPKKKHARCCELPALRDMRFLRPSFKRVTRYLMRGARGGNQRQLTIGHQLHPLTL
jgi:hypothetical protein